jgi:uncharacterized membrane protein
MKHKRLWKIIFLFFLVITIWWLYDLLRAFPQWSPRDILNLILTIISQYGLYLFVFQKKVTQIKFWRYFFFFYLIDSIIILAYIASPLKQLPLFNFLYYSKAFQNNSSEEFCWCVLFAIPVLIPLFYALYRLGFPKKLK